MMPVVWAGIGLFLLFSGSTLEVVIGMPFIEIICNGAGCLCIGYSIYNLLKVYRLDKETQTKQLKELTELADATKVCASNLNSISEVIAGITQGNDIGRENGKKLDQLEKIGTDIQTKLDNVLLKLTDTVLEIQGCKASIGTNQKELCNHLDAKFNESKTKADQGIEKLAKAIGKCENVENVIAEKTEKLIALETMLQQHESDILKVLQDTLEVMKSLPIALSNEMDTIVDTNEKFLGKMETDINNLLEDLASEESKRKRSFNEYLDSLNDYTEDTLGDVKEELQTLGSQYEQFEKIVTTIVEQMSGLAQKDLEVLEGFLHE